MLRKYSILIIGVIAVSLTALVWACGGNCSSTTKTAAMNAADCPYMAQHADANGAACNGQCPYHNKTASASVALAASSDAAPVATADKDCGKCDGTVKTADTKVTTGSKCSMHGKTASGECTMKAGETAAAATTATKDGDTKVEAKAADKLPDGITEANVYTLADGTKRFVCPVMQSHMNVADAKDHFDFEGKRYYLCCAGCIDKMTADPKVYIDALVVPANIVKMEGKKEVFICPVSKEEGNVTAKSLFVDNGGKRYYMCCSHCPPKFKADPSKFLPKAEKPADNTKS